MYDILTQNVMNSVQTKSKILSIHEMHSNDILFRLKQFRKKKLNIARFQQ